MFILWTTGITIVIAFMGASLIYRIRTGAYHPRLEQLSNAILGLWFIAMSAGFWNDGLHLFFPIGAAGVGFWYLGEPVWKAIRR